MSTQTAKLQKQDLQASKQMIILAKDYLLDFLEEDKTLSDSIELESFEESTDSFTISFSYFKRDPLRFNNQIKKTLETINGTYLDYLKDYKTVVLGKSGDLKKITSEVD